MFDGGWMGKVSHVAVSGGWGRRGNVSHVTVSGVWHLTFDMFGI